MLTRRQTMVGLMVSGSATASLAQVAAPTAGPPPTAAASVLAGPLGSNPYVAAGQAIFGIAGAVSSADWQRRTEQTLNDIKNQLVQIEQKIDILIAEFSTFSEQVRRELGAHEREVLFSQIKSHKRSIDSVLANYTDQPFPNFTPEDDQRIRWRIDEMVRLGFAIQDWGMDGFVALGFIYSELIFVSSLLKTNNLPTIRMVRDDYLRFTENALTWFQIKGNEQFAEMERIWKQIQPIGGWMYMGSAGATSYYGYYRGGPGAGFTLFERQVLTGGRPNSLDARDIPSLGDIFSNQFGPNANANTASHFLERANMAEAAFRIPRDAAAEYYGLAIGAKRVSDAIRAGVGSSPLEAGVV